MQPGRSLLAELFTDIAFYTDRVLPVLFVAQGELDVAAPRLRRRQEDPRHEVDSSGQRNQCIVAGSIAVPRLHELRGQLGKNG